MRAADATAVTMTESVVMRLEKAATLDDNPLCLHRRPEETIAIFEERGCDELRVRDEHNRRKSPVGVIVFQCNSERAVNQSVS